MSIDLLIYKYKEFRLFRKHSTCLLCACSCIVTVIIGERYLNSQSYVNTGQRHSFGWGKCHLYCTNKFDIGRGTISYFWVKWKLYSMKQCVIFIIFYAYCLYYMYICIYCICNHILGEGVYKSNVINRI